MYDEAKKRTHDLQIVWANENLKLSYGGPSQRLASGTNPQMKIVGQDTIASQNFQIMM